MRKFSDDEGIGGQEIFLLFVLGFQALAEKRKQDAKGNRNNYFFHFFIDLIFLPPGFYDFFSDYCLYGSICFPQITLNYADEYTFIFLPPKHEGTKIHQVVLLRMFSVVISCFFCHQFFSILFHILVCMTSFVSRRSRKFTQINIRLFFNLRFSAQSAGTPMKQQILLFNNVVPMP